MHIVDFTNLLAANIWLLCEIVNFELFFMLIILYRYDIDFLTLRSRSRKYGTSTLAALLFPLVDRTKKGFT